MTTGEPFHSASPPLATITVYEQSSPYDDFDTESGQGHADGVEAVEVERVAIYADERDAGEWFQGTHDLDVEISSHLADLGVSQWNGGNTAYDPDGSRMAADAAGTITTRWALVVRTGESS